VAFRSRLLDLFGQIWHVLVCVFFTASIRWQELGHVGKVQLGISANKAWSSFSVLAYLRSVGRWLLVFSAASPRRKMVGEGSSKSSVNKRFHLLVSFLCALLACLASRGGEGVREESVLVAGIGRWWELRILQQPAIQSRWYMIDRRLRWPKGDSQSSASSAGTCSISMWRPYKGREAVHIFLSGPSGLVPGAGEECRWVVLRSPAV
jgi:hypothetical protein